MSAWVTDASVIAAAFFDEPHEAKAKALLASSATLHAPDLLAAELANVIWKRHRRGEVDVEEARDVVQRFGRLPLHWTPSRTVAAAAVELALATGRTAYDCIYIALAIRQRCPMVTTDKRLVNGLSDGPFAGRVMLLGDWTGSS